MKIFFYAFANTSFFFNEVIKESKKLNDDIEWGILYPRGHWKNSSNELVKKENILYLYENFDDIYNSIDFKVEKYYGKLDNIYKLLDSSKNKYKTLDSDIQLKSAFTIYKIYKEFLIKKKPDYLVFPDLEVVDGLILFNICKELNIETLYITHTRYLKKSFFAQDYYETLPKYFGNATNKDFDLAKKILDDFYCKNINPLNIDELKTDKIISINIPNIFYRFIRGLYLSYKYESKLIEEADFLTKIKMNVSNIIKKYRKIIFNLYKIKFFHIKKSNDWIPQNYILFPLQVTPESSINTLEQYFIEQERLIDLIRYNMPNNYYLLLKEHPSMIGIRKTEFYKKLRKKSGCLLVSPYLDTEEFVNGSKMVVSVTGTIGLECYFNNKPILLFGPTFFSHLVDRFECYNTLKQKIYDVIQKTNFSNNEEKIKEIAKIINISYDFFMNDPIYFPEVMSKNNIKMFLDAIKNHINRLKK